MYRTPRWMSIWPDEPDQREEEIRSVIGAGYSRRTVTWWYWLRKLGPSAEYDLPPKDDEVTRRRIQP